MTEEQLVEELAQAMREYIHKAGIAVRYEDYAKAILPIIRRELDIAAQARKDQP